jgi:hypothetical protein
MELPDPRRPERHGDARGSDLFEEAEDPPLYWY